MPGHGTITSRETIAYSAENGDKTVPFGCPLAEPSSTLKWISILLPLCHLIHKLLSEEVIPHGYFPGDLRGHGHSCPFCHTTYPGELDSLDPQKRQVGQSQATRGDDSNGSLCPQLCFCTLGPQSVSCLIPWGTRGFEDQEWMPKLVSQETNHIALVTPADA